MVVQPRPRQLGAHAQRLSLPRTLPPSTLAPMPYADGDALAPARRSCAALARDSARSSQAPKLATMADGQRGLPAATLLPGAPCTGAECVSTEHSCA
jgi:hypothetical protein